MSRWLNKANGLAALGALSLGLAWQVPGSTTCALLGWLSAFLVCALVKQQKTSYRSLYLFGIISNSLGFYWLIWTIKDFGGFGIIPALFLFLLFATISSLQYLVFVFAFNRLPILISNYGLRVACAWVVSETISVRIFPWHFGHSQLNFLALAQTATIGGSTLISFLMFMFCEALLLAKSNKFRDYRQTIALLFVTTITIYGAYQVKNYSEAGSSKIDLAVVQANISLEEKHNQKFFAKNTERYVNLSQSIKKPQQLIVWPESVIVDFIYDNTLNRANDPRLPTMPNNAGLLTGALTFDADKNVFNSALFIDAKGDIPTPYHKQVLMPFGEYTPFSDYIPWLKEINPTPDFTPGKDEIVFDVSAAKISPLICYEDIVPAISRSAVNLGANLLVNLTNDAWFGNTAAPYQHHLIASFRAIENQRYLVRSTNSGLTAIVNPLGQTVASLAPYSEGVIESSVALLDGKTIYNSYYGYLFPWIIVGLSALLILTGRISRS